MLHLLLFTINIVSDYVFVNVIIGVYDDVKLKTGIIQSNLNIVQLIYILFILVVNTETYENRELNRRTKRENIRIWG